MSSPLAIAAVTSTLRNLLEQGLVLDPELADATVSTRPPDQARGDNTANQLNLFLYSTEINPAWNNACMPGQLKNGESGQPPLPLVLNYMITAFGRDNDDILGHRVIGRSMSILHDHPLLGRDEIEAALPAADLNEQVERVRITPGALSLDDMTKLWNSFQTEYRLSTTYQASVVLIESSRPAKTPLPVLTRGEEDQGASVQGDLIPPFPTLTELLPPHQQPSAQLGDTLTLNGFHLDGDSVTVGFSNPRLAAPIAVAAAGGTAQQISVQIPNDPADWVAGAYSLDVTISKAGEQDRTTNALPFALAPQILNIDPPSPIARDGGGNVTLTLTVSPEIRPAQRAALLLGDREVLAQAHAVQTDTLTFLVQDAPLGARFVRLRIDGVDSLLVDRSVTPPAFDSAMEVTIT